MAPTDAVLFQMAQKLRRHSLESTAEAGSGHPTSCMSAADILSVLFFSEMRYDPRDPSGHDADVFVLSKGHAAPILWAVLKEAGAISEDLLTLRRLDSPLEGHPTPHVPWVRVATGSLGQGLCATAGMAWARRADAAPGRFFCLMGDGESAEGSVWEAAQFASFHGLDNLCAIVDVNRLGQSGPTMYEHDLSVYEARFRAFGWEAASIDGHDVDGRARGVRAGARDEGQAVRGHRAHAQGQGRLVPRGPRELARQAREEGRGAAEGRGRARRHVASRSRSRPAAIRRSPSARRRRRRSRPPTSSARRSRPARRTARRSRASAKTAPQVVAIDGDTKNSTYADRFKAVDPHRFAEAYIAEQNMVGAALGMSTEGKIPFASTFACFLTRAYDFIRMAAISKPSHLVLVGSHAGVSIGEDGASQMALEDLAMMRAITGATVLYPSDAVSAERLVETAARTPGIVYIRTSRPKTKVLYANDEPFPVGGSKTLRTSAKDAVTVVAAGVTVPEALEAHDRAGEGRHRRPRDRPLQPEADRRDDAAERRRPRRRASSRSRTTACAAASARRSRASCPARRPSRSWACARSRARASRRSCSRCTASTRPRSWRR